MKFAVLGYNNTINIGDSIQTIAVLQHVDEDYIVIDRDRLNEYSGEPCVVVMNGWFSHKPQNWPPSDAITPIFFGFHITPKAASEYEKHKSYFKRFEPIGCRDAGTAEIIKGWGVNAYVSGCATMTFPERAASLSHGKVILVDVDRRMFSKSERKDFLNLTQQSHIDYADNSIRNIVANSLLNFYKSNASYVITSRIHCAMPCFAMGIPVLYCGTIDYRTSLIDDIGIKKISPPRYKRLKFSNLKFSYPDYKAKKISIANDIRNQLSKHDLKLKKWDSKEL